MFITPRNNNIIYVAVSSAAGAHINTCRCVAILRWTSIGSLQSNNGIKSIQLNEDFTRWLSKTSGPDESNSLNVHLIKIDRPIVTKNLTTSMFINSSCQFQL